MLLVLSARLHLISIVRWCCCVATTPLPRGRATERDTQRPPSALLLLPPPAGECTPAPPGRARGGGTQAHNRLCMYDYDFKNVTGGSKASVITPAATSRPQGREKCTRFSPTLGVVRRIQRAWARTWATTGSSSTFLRVPHLMHLRPPASHSDNHTCKTPREPAPRLGGRGQGAPA